MNWDHYDYRIAEHYLSALINGDKSGMTDTESVEFNAWESQARDTATAALIRQFETAGPPSEHCKVRPVLRLQRPGAK
jgi:hypothetical protein